VKCDDEEDKKKMIRVEKARAYQERRWQCQGWQEICWCWLLLLFCLCSIEGLLVHWQHKEG